MLTFAGVILLLENVYLNANSIGYENKITYQRS